MGFDVQNFGIGLLAGWATAYGVYRVRGPIAGVLGVARQSAGAAQQSATATADSRYVNDLVENADLSHLAGEAVPLSRVLIEPRFIPAPRLATPPDDEIIHDIFRVIPLTHDHPHLYAPYNVDTLSASELGRGSRALALLGLPGSGRTTALYALALYSLGKVQFKPPVDAIQQRLDSEEAAMDEKARAVRVKERIMIEQRAKERLANEQGQTFDAVADEESKNAIPLFRRLMPILVHLSDILVKDEFNGSLDPAEPLVRATQFRLKRVTASTMPRTLYTRLNRGQALVLIDGYDDLPAHEQPRAQAWLKAFLEQYSSNFIIVVGPVHGFGPLADMGFTPVYLRPWNDRDTNAAVTGWSDNWATMTGRRRKADMLAPEAVERARTNNRALLPFEVTCKVWNTFAPDANLVGYEAWLRGAIARLLPNDQAVAGMLPSLAQLAMLQLDEGYLSATRLQALAIADETTSSTASSAERRNEAHLDQTEANATADDKSEDAETTTAQGRLLATLRKSGLLVRYRGDRYQFRHPLLAAYLASLALRDASPEEAALRVNQPHWAQAVAYLALHAPVEPLIAARLNTTPDVLSEHLLQVARWCAYAPADAAWRGDILRLLGTLLIAPNQYPALRERVAAALLDARDHHVLLIFRRAVRNSNADIRRLACLGMGALGEVEGVRDLKPLLNDQIADVQLTAGMALGAVGNEEALEAMLMAFTTGTEPLRQAMAEAFAALPKDGYSILHEAVIDQDMMLRRASVFGLRRLNTTWALVAIYRAFLEDEQWYVRSAAQQAFQELQYGRDVSPTNAYPTVEELSWLREWASQRGESLPKGDGAQQVLLRAMQEGEPGVRALAALNLGQLGLATTIKAIYAATRDRQDDVRAAAHASLSALQNRMGVPLPAPV